MIIDKISNYNLGNPNVDPLENISLTQEEKEQYIKDTILSASGWRRVFASNNDEESNIQEITDAGKYLVATAALSFSEFLKQKYHKSNICVLVATDSRPTGFSIAEIVIRILLGTGVNVKYSAITAAPEVFSAAAINPEIDGFAYISASHNPIGHNGFKFGFDDGGVIGGKDASSLIELFTEKYRSENTLNLLQQISNSISCERINQVFEEIPNIKKITEQIYFDFTKEVITAKQEKVEQDKILANISKSALNNPIGVLAEFNGSARSISIDKNFLEKLNIKVKTINDVPGQIVHRIVPEGHSLDLCREELEKAYKNDSAFVLGFVPDNDGDRGNIVYINEKTKKAEIIHAQEIFALSCVIEMAYLEYSEEISFDANGQAEVRSAIAVNGPTSNRIDEIANYFGAKVLRAEVGEANVVNLAKDARKKGVLIRILGEGSNGGNITYPAAVRDPLNTIGALLKLLALKSIKNKKGLFEIWCSRSNQMDLYKEDFTIQDVLDTLPKFVTTSAYEDDAIIDIKTKNHAKLKEAYESIFQEEWESKKLELRKKYNFYTFKVIDYEGTNERYGMGSQYRSLSEKGGFKILFSDEQGCFRAFMWMRGSRTEPVFRVMVDIKSSDIKEEKALLKWHREIIAKADKIANA